VNILEPALIEGVIDESMNVLGTTGVTVDHPPAFELLRERGVEGDPDTMCMRFSRAQIEAAIDSAPASIKLYDRDGNYHASLEGDTVNFVPASSALRILDDQSGEIRDGNSKDFTRYIQVADGLEHISYLSTAFVPKDVPADVADAWRLYLALSHSKKPVVSGAFTAEGVKRIAKLLGFFRKDAAELAAKPLSILTCCPNTPMRWGEDPVTNLMDCARFGIPTEIVPVLLLGMISPTTTLGALVLHTAEVLSGLTIAQLVNPGCPVIFGGAPAAFHMRLMTNPMTAVEALQIYCGYAQVAKHLKLPCQAYMALSDSKRNDAQSGAETGIGAFLAAMAGINSVSGPGMLDYVNCFSLEKLVFDDEIAAHALRFITPVEVKQDLPTRDLIEQLLEDKHLLTADHTLEHWKNELYLPGPMVDRTNWDQWEQQGSKDEQERARDVIEEKLDDYEPEPLPDDMHDEIRTLFQKTALDENVELPDARE
jgi:trimethylamine--corrinoid protein Co-methyltransferase